MEYEYEESSLTDAEKQALHERLANDDTTPLTATEREYLINETIKLKKQTKDLLMKKLMLANKYSKDKRVEESEQVAAGLISDSILALLDALDAAIEEVAVFITNIDEGPGTSPSQEMVWAYAAERSKATFDIIEYNAYHIVAGFFKD